MEFHPEWVDWTIEQPVEMINRLLPTPLPQGVLLIARSCNFVFLFTWFEPLVLRLNWTRGMAWIALRIAPFVFENFLSLDGQVYERIIFFVVSSGAQVLVLHGWRSRPWMCLVGVMLAFTAIGFVKMIPRELQNRFGWLGFVALMVIYSVPLIYGTRLLRPEERAPFASWIWPFPNRG